MVMLLLGVEATYVGRNPLDYIIEVEFEKVVRHLEPNFSTLAKIFERGVIVASVSET